MNLRNFVSGALTQIAQGIADAQEQAHGKYCISPAHSPYQSTADVHLDSSNRTLECVEFDIAVSTKSNIDGKGSFDFWVVDSNIQGSLENQNASRIKFQVYVAWPRQQ